MAANSEWFVERGGKKFGPMTSEQLKVLAASGRLKPDDFVLRGDKRAKAKDVKGLFQKPAAALVTTATEIVRERWPVTPVAESIIDATPRTQFQECAFCGESILSIAKKCKHCGEILDAALRATMAPQASPAPTPQTTVHVLNTIHSSSNQRWSRGVAILLSFFIPGLGQMYKGQIINGVVWFFIVSVGYFLLIVPGLILHLCCIAGAAMGDPYK